MNLKNKLRTVTQNDFVIFSLIGLYIGLSLLPLLYSGYYSDDMVNTAQKGELALQGISFVRHALRTLNANVLYHGRFLPVSLLIGLSLYNVLPDSLILFKAATLLLVVFDVFLFGHLIKLISKDKYLSYVLMVTIPLFFQFRLYHDPILSFAGSFQILFAMLIGSIIFLQQFLNSNKKRHIIASVFFYNLCLYSYEFSFALLPLYVFLIVLKYRNFKDSLRVSIPYICSFAIGILVNFICRFWIKDPSLTSYRGTSFSFNALWIIATFIVQTFSALPLSYYLGNPSHIFNYRFASLVNSVKITDLLSMAILTSIYSLSIKQIKPSGNLKTFFVAGLSFLLLPAILISLSGKYQGELLRLGPGMGYLPVYFQYFGALMVLAGFGLLFNQCVRGKKTRIICNVCIILLLNIILVINSQNNRIIVDKANIDLRYRRDALEKALANGILQNVPDNSRILILDKYSYDPYPKSIKSNLKGWAGGGYRWINKALVFFHSKKRVDVFTNIGALVSSSSLRKGRIDFEDDNVFAMIIASYPEKFHIKEGYVFIGKINSITLNETDINKSQLDVKGWKSLK